MARYNKEFLVPYLRDVCTLHMAGRKLVAQQKKLEHQIFELQSEKGRSDSTKPFLEKEYSSGVVFGLIVGAFFLVLGIFSFIPALDEGIPSLTFAVFCAAVLGAGIIWSVIRTIRERKESNELKMSQYYQRMEANRKIDKQHKKDLEKVPVLRAEIQQCIAEQQKVRNVLSSVYSVNIIPTHYRNSYAAMYLYDYFNNSREDDLAMALNTYVLEQIKERLDKLISQMSDVILNQYMIMDNQQAAMERANRHHAEMCDKLNRLQTTAEEHSVYLDMIEANTATMKYFAIVDYIRKC